MNYTEDFSASHDLRKTAIGNLAQRMAAAADAWILARCAEHLGRPSVLPEDLLGILELQTYHDGAMDVVLEGRNIGSLGPITTKQDGLVITATRKMIWPGKHPESGLPPA